ncbi:MAG: Glu/Leu/Phe/Val dehydrogenase dimerization domain-containing protein [Wolbachia sp.]|nr:Glu/Leu/Phe/Val dehydrogenase dimerization domain-containing protein [Wolbachia sp.]
MIFEIYAKHMTLFIKIMLEKMLDCDIYGVDTHEELYIKCDKKTGLKAIISIHNSSNRPALGGCRFISYDSSHNALTDVLKLSKSMSFKAILAGVPYGGGKAVILKPEQPFNRQLLFKGFGDFVNQLGGRYITTMDSGIVTKDLEVISNQTPYVTGLGIDGNPAPYTAEGVIKGIEAALNFKYGTSKMNGIRIAIQGVGNVGFCLGKKAYERGAKLTICDYDSLMVSQCLNEFTASVVSPNEIYSVECDVFAPCGLGSTINPETISKLKATIIAGSANNQLSDDTISELINERNILYAPDYVINAGGLIHVAGLYSNVLKSQIESKIAAIYDTLIEIFISSKRLGKSTNDVAYEIASSYLQNPEDINY